MLELCGTARKYLLSRLKTCAMHSSFPFDLVAVTRLASRKTNRSSYPMCE